MNGITVEKLLQLSNPIIIDVRKHSDYTKGHINGATNIPYYTLLSDYSTCLDKNKIYYLYCDSGSYSADVVTKLNNFGYNTVNIIGGYEYFKNKVR